MTAHTKELIGLLKDFKNEVINKLDSPLRKVTVRQVIEETFVEYEEAIIESEEYDRNDFDLSKLGQK